MSKRVADVVIETLEAAGAKTCYGIVGDTLNRIAHAIDASEIDWVHMRHQEAGAFAAQAEALRANLLRMVSADLATKVRDIATAMSDFKKPPE